LEKIYYDDFKKIKIYLLKIKIFLDIKKITYNNFFEFWLLTMVIHFVILSRKLMVIYWSLKTE